MRPLASHRLKSKLAFFLSFGRLGADRILFVVVLLRDLEAHVIAIPAMTPHFYAMFLFFVCKARLMRSP